MKCGSPGTVFARSVVWRSGRCLSYSCWWGVPDRGLGAVWPRRNGTEQHNCSVSVLFWGWNERLSAIYAGRSYTGRNTQIRLSYYRRRKLFSRINARTWCSCRSFTHELWVGELNSVPASFAKTWCGVEGEGDTLLATPDESSPVAERTRADVERYQKRHSKVVLNFI